MLSITSFYSKKINERSIISFLLMLMLMAVPGRLMAQDKQNKADSDASMLKFGVISIENARSLLVSENVNSAIGVYAQLVRKDTSNVTVNSEYGYALALGGIYDAALARLDRIWYNRGDHPEALYFASQIYALMGLDDLAQEFGQGQKPPAWLSSFAPHLLRKYKRELHSSGSRETLVNMFKQANRLTAQSYYLQALGRFGEITASYPGEYLPYIGYSIALEKAGMLKNSLSATETAIRTLGDAPENAETKQILEQRCATLKANIEVNSNNSGIISPAQPSGSGTQMLLYAGGLIGSSYTSINGKFGVFMSKASYATFDAGFTALSNTSAASLGFTLYQRGKIMAGGMGLSASLTKGSTEFFYKVSLGPSIMNKSGTASWDIFLDGQRSFSKNGITTMGLSVGHSIYFGKRK